MSSTRSPLLLPLLPNGNQPPNNDVLGLEPLLPPAQGLHLLRPEVRQRVQRAVQVLGQHGLVEAAARQSARGVAPGKVGVGALGAVKVAARRHVEHAAPHGEVDRPAVGAVVREEGAGREGAEDGGWRLGRQGRQRRALEVERVGGVEEGAEEEDVEGGKEAGAGKSVVVSFLLVCALI